MPDRKMHRFHLGFPVDTEGATPLYYLVYPSIRSTGFRLGTIGKKNVEKIHRDDLPGGVAKMLPLIPKKTRSLLFLSSRDVKQVVDGDSMAAATLLAGCATGRIADCDDTNAPLVLISCRIYGDPRLLSHAKLARVTTADNTEAQTSLYDKWRGVVSASAGGRRAALVLYKDDFLLLRSLLTEKGEPYREVPLRDMATELNAAGVATMPLLVAADEDDLDDIAEVLKIEFEDRIATGLSAGKVIALVTAAVLLAFLFFSGLLYQLQSLSVNTLARGYYRATCAVGYKDGCNYYATMLDDGLYGPEDNQEAIKYYEIACSGGSVSGCYNLAGMFYHGESTPVDKVKAAKYFRISCENEDWDGCVMLAVMYEEGEGGLPKDPREACKYYRTACEKLVAQGCNNYGVALQSGVCASRDDRRSPCYYFRESCRLGDKLGCDKMKECAPAQ